MTARITAAEARALLDATHPDGCPPECSGSCVGAALRLDAHGAPLARAVISLEGEVAAWRDIAARAREAADDAAMRELTLEMGVWDVVHPSGEGQPPFVPSADEVIAAVTCLRAERDHARAEVERLRAEVEQHRQGLIAIATALGCDDVSVAAIAEEATALVAELGKSESERTELEDDVNILSRDLEIVRRRLALKEGAL